MKRLLAFLGLLVLASLPTWAASYYFSDCGCDPAGTAKQQDACNRPTLADAYCAGDFSDSGTFYCGKTCYGFPPTCIDSCSGNAAVATFNCSGAIPNGGQLANPWCLAPEALSNGTGNATQNLRNSFAAMQDGGAGTSLTTELAAGDTVNLCAGYCDGQGAANWYVQPTSGSTFLTVQTAGTDSSHKITIQPYPGESVTLVGDSNHNGIADSGEVGTWMSGVTQMPHWWTLEGDPNGTGSTHLAFTRRTGGVGFLFTSAGGHLHDFTMSGVEVQGDTQAIWNSQSQGPLQDSCGQSTGYTIYLEDPAAGTNSFTHDWFHDLCGFLLRYNFTGGTPAANIIFSMTDSIIDNVGAPSVSNGFSIRGTYSSTSYTEFRRNHVIDSGQVSFHDSLQHVYITDNLIEETGQHQNTDSQIRGIYVSYGTTPNCSWSCTSGNKDCGSTGQSQGTCAAGSCVHTPDCSMDDILIERNVLRGVASGYCSGGCNGLLGGGIVFDGAYNDSGATAFPTGVTIDNNIVEYQQERISGATSCSMSPDFGAMAIGYRPLVATTGGVITNNTLYYDSHPLMVCGSAATVTDNLIVRVANPGNGSVGPVTFDSGAAASTIANNDVYNASGVLLTVNGTDYTCTSPSTWSSSDPGTNDLCALPAFAACDSATYCASVVASPLSWDLHLAGNQACVGAGASCSTLDIDQQTRPSPCDIGADQWFFPQLANPTYPPYPNPPSVSKAQ